MEAFGYIVLLMGFAMLFFGLYLWVSYHKISKRLEEEEKLPDESEKENDPYNFWGW